VLEAGSGRGVVTTELQRRARGRVVALDLDPTALAGGDYPDDALRVAGDCCALPFPDACFDLALFQNVLMWIPDAARAVFEATRTLRPGGALVAIEPDYGAMIEHPDLGLRELWMSGLSRSGADPLVGRKLPGVCEAAGLDVWVELSHLPRTAQTQAVELLTDLPLDADERGRAGEAMSAVAEREGSWVPLLHLPYFLIVAEKP
jgi:SAM-dependent methyltransferase